MVRIARALVVLAAEQQGGPLAAEVASQRRGVALELRLEVGVGGLVEQLQQRPRGRRRATSRSRHVSISVRRPSASRRTFCASRWSSQNPGSWVSVSSCVTRCCLASRSKTPRGRPDPFGQVADGGRVHLVPDLEILEQQRPQLDEPQGRLAPRDDGVHAGTVAIVGTDAAVAVAIQRGGVTARCGSRARTRSDRRTRRPRPASRTPSLRNDAGHWRLGAGAGSAACRGYSGGPWRQVLAQYTRPIPYRQGGKNVSR